MNETEFDAFYYHAYSRVCSQAQAIRGDATGIQECVQEAFVKAWQRREAFARTASREAWVRKVAYHVGVSRGRTWGKRRADQPEQSVAPTTGPADVVALRQALDQLQAKPRRAVVLSYMLCLTPQEIADEMDVSAATVTTWLAGASETMAQVYPGQGSPEEIHWGEVFEEAFPEPDLPPLTPAEIRALGNRGRLLHGASVAIAMAAILASVVGSGVFFANPSTPKLTPTLETRQTNRPGTQDPTAEAGEPPFRATAAPSASGSATASHSPTAGIPVTSTAMPPGTTPGPNPNPGAMAAAGVNAGVAAPAWTFTKGSSILETNGLLPAPDKLGWPLEAYAMMTVGGTWPDMCAGLNSMNTLARVKGIVRAQDEGQLAIRIMTNPVAAVVDAVKKCHAAVGARVTERPNMNFGAGAVTWMADLPAGKWGTEGIAKGYYTVVRVGDKTAYVTKWAGKGIPLGTADEIGFAAGVKSVIAQLKSGGQQGWPGAHAGGVDARSFFGPGTIPAPSQGPWQEWLYDEFDSDPGEGLSSGPKRSLIMTVNSVELAVHLRDAGSPAAACALMNDTIAAHKAAGATYNHRTDYSIAKADYQFGTFGGRPSGVMCTGNYAAVVTIRNSQEGNVVMNAMAALAGRLG